MFNEVTDCADSEIDQRGKTTSKILKFGIDYLDHATRGIYPDDLILIGAPSGLGKTQLCCNIAQANIGEGRRVHYIALEASDLEIQRRLKYPLVIKHYLADPVRRSLGHKINYPEWLMGKYLFELADYEVKAAKEYKEKFKGLFVYYKQDKFGINELIETVVHASKKTDLIIIDHVHYFDFDDENENRAIKEIAKMVRSLSLEENKPIVLVAHLRKRDRANEELVAGLDEFHGSSDLFKIATKVITMAGGNRNPDGTFDTFFRVAKNRIDGGVIRYCAREFFDPKLGGYVSGRYEIGRSNQSKNKSFETVSDDIYPDWARQRDSSRGSDSASERRGLPYKD